MVQRGPGGPGTPRGQAPRQTGPGLPRSGGARGRPACAVPAGPRRRGLRSVGAPCECLESMQPVLSSRLRQGEPAPGGAAAGARAPERLCVCVRACVRIQVSCAVVAGSYASCTAFSCGCVCACACVRARARRLLDGQAEAVLVCPAGVAHLAAAAAEEGGLQAALGPVRASSRWVVAGPGGLHNAVRDS